MLMPNWTICASVPDEQVFSTAALTVCMYTQTCLFSKYLIYCDTVIL